MPNGLLATASLSAATETTIYVPPTGISATCFITLTRLVQTDTTVRVSVPLALPSPEETFIEYDALLEANRPITIGPIYLADEQPSNSRRIAAYSTLADTSVSVVGIEKSISSGSVNVQGAVKPLTGTPTLVVDSPASGFNTVGMLIACNQSATQDTIRYAIASTSTPTDAEYVGELILNQSYPRHFENIILSPSDKLVVQSANGTSNFLFTGIVGAI